MSKNKKILLEIADMLENEESIKCALNFVRKLKEAEINEIFYQSQKIKGSNK